MWALLFCTMKDTVMMEMDANGDGLERRRSSGSRPDLIEKDGKKVSRTSTGKRKFHNKSKLGCDTCKRRRVKCDEGKPICVKCKNMGIECTYLLAEKIQHQPPKSSQSPPSRKSSIPRKQSASSITAAATDSTPKPPDIVTESPGAPITKSFMEQGTAKLERLMEQNGLPTFSVKSPSSVPPPPGISSMLGQLGQIGQIGQLGNLEQLGHLGQLGQLGQLSQLGQLGGQLGQLINGGQLSQLLSATNALSSTSANEPANDNTLSVNLDSITNNPTISPQPTMSPTSAPSPLSMHQPMTSGQDFTTSLPSSSGIPYASSTGLNIVDLRLMYHYTRVVAPTITTAGISEEKIWIEDIPNLAFEFPFLMHSILAFSATHLSRTEKHFEKHVTHHRGEALRLLREAVLEISGNNTDALVASALILIMDSLANASLPSSLSPTSLPASAWIFHVKGAATILTAVWPLPVTSRFYKFISVDLSDLGDIINDKNGSISDLVCFDDSIADLYPVEYDSPYLITLAYLDKLNHEKYKSDFILRIFAFPALLDKTFLVLLMSGDLSAMRIMRSYYSLLRGFTTEMKDKVWFLEGVSKVLPADVDDYSGGGGMHMMLDFLGGGLPSMTTTNLASGLNIDINDHFMNP